MAHSRAYKKFIRTFDRSLKMVRRHLQLHEDGGEWTEEEDDLFRAAIVLVVSALDTYFTDRFREALMPSINKNGCTPELEKLLSEAGFTTGKAIGMFENKRPKRVLTNMVKRYLERFVTLNFKSVDKLYKCLGFKKSFSHQVELKSRRRTLIKSIECLVDRRHKISHAGDYNQHNRLNPIDYAAMVRRFADVRLFVRLSDELLRENQL